MTLLDRAGAFARARLIPLREAWRLWSVQLAFLGALLTAAAAGAPDALLAAWNAMPDELRALLPENVSGWISAVLFALVLVARVVKQPAAGERPSLIRSTGGKVAPRLAGVLGSAAAAVLLVTSVTLHESGRTVVATAGADGTIAIRHVSGPQYLKAYRDIIGVVTICDGDTADVRMGQVATEAECTARLERQLVAHAEPVMRCVPGLRGRANQAAASVSLAYNIGTTGFCRSTAARRFNAGDWKGGCDAFLAWNRAGGRVVQGLVNRRAAERQLCLTGI